MKLEVRFGGIGNVADLSNVTVEEAVGVFSNALAPELVVEKNDLGQIVISEPETGSQHTLMIDETGAASAFGFQVKAGTDGDTAQCALPAFAELNADDGTTVALTVSAGYRGKEDPGEWGNKLSVSIRNNKEAPGDEPETYDLTVKYNDVAVETWENLNVKTPGEGDSFRHPDIINSEFTGSKFIVISADSNQNPEPTVDGEGEEEFKPLAKGQDDIMYAGPLGLALAAALTNFDVHDVQLVCCPECSDHAVVTAGLDYCKGRGDCMFIGHTPLGQEFLDAKGYGKQHRGDKQYGALYFPWIQVADPLGERKWIPPTGHIMGVYARTERERGIWKAPAGNEAQVRGALDVQEHITNADHTDLVKNGSVNAVRFIAGKGIVIDSSRTLSTNPIWYYVNVRLLFNFVKSSLMSGLTWVVQEPNDPTLWNKVKYGSVTPFLNGLWRRGAFGPGAANEVFTVKIDAENNTPADIQQGRLNVEVYFYPSRPAETIVIIVGQQEGGASASEG